MTLLRKHRDEQGQERVNAVQLWEGGTWLFATPTGGPVNPRTDYDEWKRLLKLAGLRDGRLHDARHTAATVLLILGVAERAVMSIMGWSNSTMTARYQHLTTQVRRDIARQVGGPLWNATADANGLHATQIYPAKDVPIRRTRHRVAPAASCHGSRGILQGKCRYHDKISSSKLSTAAIAWRSCSRGQRVLRVTRATSPTSKNGPR
ncbi:tyrosine-type recombinase/integrase [Micromonospora sp. BL4]|uniref:tyrosine-type recombinase/integrase n=1 Tax=Micromonospora sp. BL4 TaxID=2478710 RepID=UPI0034CF8C6E